MQNTVAQEMAFQGVPLLLAQQVYSNTPQSPPEDFTRFNAYPTTDPRAFAAYADLLSAYQEIEKASFAVDKRELLFKLERAEKYLEYADDNIKRSTLPQFSAQIESLEEELENLEEKAEALSSNDLPLFQTQDLRDYATLLYPIIPSLEQELGNL
nr:hypothetical protein Cplu_411 [Cedratvirus plubellavi]